MVRAYTEGSRKFSHSMFVSRSELILYFEVEMDEQSVNEFAKMMSIKDDVKLFYTCIVINEASVPRTFIAYKKTDGNIKELFDISAGVSPLKILRDSIVKGDIL